MVALHWEKYMQHAREKYNREHLLQLPPITPHVARHTFCSNMASAGMNPKTLQYIMGHSDISITLNVYTHVESTDVTDEYRRITESLNSKQYTMYGMDREADLYVPQVDSVEDLEEMDDIA